MESKSSQRQLLNSAPKPLINNQSISASNSKISIVNSPIKLKPVGETTLMFDTEYNPEFKQIVKIPLELIVHPQAKKWQFRKPTPTDNLNRFLKIRYKRNYHAEKKDPEISPNLSIVKFKERDISNNQTFLNKLLEGNGYYAQDEKHFLEKGRNIIRTPNKKRHSILDSSNNKSQEFIIGINDKIYSTSVSPPKNPTKSRILHSSSPNQRSPKGNKEFYFSGCLEPELNVLSNKYIEDSNQPEIKVTRTDNVFIGRKQNAKMIINMNKIILQEIPKSKNQSIESDISKQRDTDNFLKSDLRTHQNIPSSKHNDSILLGKYYRHRNQSLTGIRDQTALLNRINSKTFSFQQEITMIH